MMTEDETQNWTHEQHLEALDRFRRLIVDGVREAMEAKNVTVHVDMDGPLGKVEIRVYPRDYR